MANAIAIPLPLCFSCFVRLRRFRENFNKTFYFYLSRTCGSPGGTPSVISLALRKVSGTNENNRRYRKKVQCLCASSRQTFYCTSRDLKQWHQTTEFLRAHQTFVNGQPPSKLRIMIPQKVKEVVPYVATSTSGQERPYPAGSLLYSMKKKMQNIKKVYFCTKLFKNTIFIMYEWWRFQRYRFCITKSEIRIGIEKFNFFLVHLVRSIQTKLKLDNKLKTWKQKIVGWALNIVVCAWNVRNKPITRQ